jgi:hypothetical protein
MAIRGKKRCGSRGEKKNSYNFFFKGFNERGIIQQTWTTTHEEEEEEEDTHISFDAVIYLIRSVVVCNPLG